MRMRRTRAAIGKRSSGRRDADRSFEARAQCATCGNPALTAGASDLGKALGEEVVETPALTLSGSYSFTNFDKFQNAEGIA